MDKIIKNERVPGTSDHSLFRLSNNFRKIPSLMVTNKAVFKLFQNLNLQIYASQFMASETIPLPFVHLNLESVERKEKNYKNFNISRTKRAFWWTKNFL